MMIQFFLRLGDAFSGKLGFPTGTVFAFQHFLHLRHAVGFHVFHVPVDSLSAAHGKISREQLGSVGFSWVLEEVRLAALSLRQPSRMLLNIDETINHSSNISNFDWFSGISTLHDKI